eukprot:Platyproteum_vivax@DN5960_c0_g1_i1.p1
MRGLDWFSSTLNTIHGPPLIFLVRARTLYSYHFLSNRWPPVERAFVTTTLAPPHLLCHLGCKGVAALTEAVMAFNGNVEPLMHLRSLNINCCELKGDAGGEVLGAFLSFCCYNVRDVQLWGNPLGSRGVLSMLVALEGAARSLDADLHSDSSTESYVYPPQDIAKNTNAIGSPPPRGPRTIGVPSTYNKNMKRHSVSAPGYPPTNLQPHSRSALPPHPGLPPPPRRNSRVSARVLPPEGWNSLAPPAHARGKRHSISGEIQSVPKVKGVGLSIASVSAASSLSQSARSCCSSSRKSGLSLSASGHYPSSLQRPSPPPSALQSPARTPSHSPVTSPKNLTNTLSYRHLQVPFIEDTTQRRASVGVCERETKAVKGKRRRDKKKKKRKEKKLKAQQKKVDLMKELRTLNLAYCNLDGKAGG